MTPALDELVVLEQSTLCLRPEQRVKSDLIAAARRLLASVDRHRHGVPRSGDACASLETLVNNGGLVLFHAGEIDAARTICSDAVRFFTTLAATSGETSWVQHALQPHANLARIAAASGGSDAALDVFRGLHAFVTHGLPLTLGDLTLDSAEAAVLLRNAQIVSVARAIYIFDSLKTLLCAQAYERLLAFADEIARDAALGSDASRLAALEARARAYAGLRQWDHAASTLQSLIGRCRDMPYAALGLATLLADVYARRGDVHQAARVCQRIDVALQKLDASRRGDCQASRRVYYWLALTEGRLGDWPLMARHAARARQLTTDCGDQVGHLKALLASLEASLHGTCVHDNSVSDLVAHSVRGARDMHYRFERAVALLHAGRVLTTSPQQGGLSARSCLAESAALFETLPATPPVDWPGLTHAARERSDSSVTRVRRAQARVMNIEPEPCFVALRNGLTDLVGPAAQDVFRCV